MSGQTFIAGSGFEGFTVNRWMAELGLPGNVKEIYALVYRFSGDGGGVYSGGIQYAADFVGCSPRTARRAFKRLLDVGLICEAGHYVRGNHSEHRCYRVDLAAVQAAAEAWENRLNASDGSPLYGDADESDDVAPEPESDGPTTDLDDGNSATPEPVPELETADPQGAGYEYTVDDAWGFQALADISVNRNKLSRAVLPYRDLLAKGYSHSELLEAWRMRQEDARASGAGDGYMPALWKFLSGRFVGEFERAEYYLERARRAGSAPARLKDAPEVRVERVKEKGRHMYIYTPPGSVPTLLRDPSGTPVDALRVGPEEARAAAVRAVLDTAV